MYEIDTTLVKKLIQEQFPCWLSLAIKPVAKSGHDNRTFHLGDNMLVRLPSGEAYAAQIHKEAAWLPWLKPHLSLPITFPIALGQPTANYPFPWSINSWIDGETATYQRISDMNLFAVDLANFLRELQSIDTTDAPTSGKHNFYRGGDLSVYHDETQHALKKLCERLPVGEFSVEEGASTPPPSRNPPPTQRLEVGGLPSAHADKLRTLWNKAIQSKWGHNDVWIHGDIAPNNLLVQDGILSGVIDFGVMSIGDPSCDYAIAWTFLNANNRKTFFDTIGCDNNTICRARGWALWKALITVDSDNPEVSDNSHYTIQSILEETEDMYPI